MIYILITCRWGYVSIYGKELILFMLTQCELFSAIYMQKQMSDKLNAVLQLFMIIGLQNEANHRNSATVGEGYIRLWAV